MSNDNLDDMIPELAQIGDRVARMSREEAPADLVARTLAHISKGYKPVKRVFWMLRPITNPLARIAAAAAIIFALAPMIDMNVADPLGSRIESKIIGRETADRIEHMMDSMLAPHTPSYTQDDLDSVIGIRRPEFAPIRRVSLNSSKTKGV